MPETSQGSSGSPRRPQVGETDLEAMLTAMPASTSTDIRAVAIQLVCRAEAMGLLDPVQDPADPSRVIAALEAFSAAGVAQGPVSRSSMEADLRRALDLMNAEVERTAVPGSELPAMRTLLGVDLLAAMTRVAPEELEPEVVDETTVSVELAQRVHLLALIVADLAGSYRDFGIRRWFERERTTLGGRSPRAVLASSPDDSDAAVEQVRHLARALTSLGAT